MKNANRFLALNIFFNELKGLICDLENTRRFSAGKDSGKMNKPKRKFKIFIPAATING
jgi:hypothetical protein